MILLLGKSKQVYKAVKIKGRIYTLDIEEFIPFEKRLKHCREMYKKEISTRNSKSAE